MEDPAVTVIGEIADKYNEILDKQFPGSSPTPFAVGEKEKTKHASAPRIAWIDAPSAVEPGQILGGNPKGVGVDACRFTVEIWNVDRGSTRAAMHRLVEATRFILYANNVRWGRYDWVNEGRINKSGEQINADVEILLPVAEVGMTEVTIEHIHQQVFQNSELVCDEQQDA